MVGVFVLQAEMFAAMTDPGGARANPCRVELPPNQLLSIMAALLTAELLSLIYTNELH